METADEVFSYYRTLNDTRRLIVTNFSNEEQAFHATDEVIQTVIHNAEETVTSLENKTLAPLGSVCRGS